MTQRTEREKLTLAARAGGIPIMFNKSDRAFFASGPFEGCQWDPHQIHQCAELMVKCQLFGICGDTVEDWMQRVFDAAVYQGSLMEVTEE